MTAKEKTGGTLHPLSRKDTIRLSRKGLAGLLEAAIGFLLGAVLSGAELFGVYAPFGVAAAAAAGSGVTGFGTMCGACLGYLCLEGLTDGMRYAASAILVYSVAFAFFDTRIYRRRWFMPSIAALLCAATGIICRAGALWGESDIVYFVTEVVFSVLACCGYHILFVKWPTITEVLGQPAPRQTAGLLTLGTTLLMSLSRVELLETVSLGRMLAALGILLCARRGVGAGVLTGACAGVALDLASGRNPCFSLAFSLAGLTSGLCKGWKKPVAAAVYLLTCLAVVLWTPTGTPQTGLVWEGFGAGLVFCLLPTEKRKRSAVPAEGGGGFSGVVSRRMAEMANAFHGLHETVRESLTAGERETENPAAIFTRTADKVCRRCVLNQECWQKDYQTTRAALNDVTGPMLDRGRVLATDFPTFYANRCVHFPEFIGQANRELTGYLRRRQTLRRTREARSALCGQYARLDELMERVAAEFSTGLTPDLPRQERLKTFLAQRGTEGGAAYYDAQARLRVEVPALEELHTPTARRELSRLMGVPLRAGEEAHGRLLFAQAEPFRAVAAVASVPRNGETVSGDVSLSFRREDGVFFVLLCDGMGSGPEARQESARTARLIESFLRAGAEAGQALETVAAALALREEAGGSTSVDLLEIDLFTGKSCIYKQGAAPSYTRRGEQVRCAEGESLPVGMVAGVQARPDGHPFRGEGGDWILLISDGVLCGGEDEWLRSLLLHQRGKDPEELSERILRESRSRTGGEDDGTVIAVHLIENGEEED